MIPCLQSVPAPPSKRLFGRTEMAVSPLGMGCSPLAGPSYCGNTPLGRGDASDEESVRALHCAFDRGVTLLDTADSYGAGHSEHVIGSALQGRRDEIFVITKFGNLFDESTRQVHGSCWTEAYIQQACDASLRRLGTDYIDCYMFHCNHAPLSCIDSVIAALEQLTSAGKIRSFGWSTDHIDRAEAMATSPGCVAIEHECNVLDDSSPMLELCNRHNLASVNRGPLAMGLLTGKYGSGCTAPLDDVRGARGPSWMKYFRDGKPNAQWLSKVEAIREVLQSDGRTLAQGALAWLWARSERTFPIPGFKTQRQVEENCAALHKGPLTSSQVGEIARVLRED